MIEITLQGIEAIRETFARLVPEVQKKVVDGMAQAAFDTAQAGVDAHTQTGALARSLRMIPDGYDGWIIYHDLAHAAYAPFVHWGAKPHVIKPRDKKALRWPSGKGEKTEFVFAQWVNHPGYEGDPWLERAADKAIHEFDAIVRRMEGAP